MTQFKGACGKSKHRCHGGGDHAGTGVPRLKEMAWMIRTLCIAALAATASAQTVPTSPNTTLTSEPPREPWTLLVFSGNPTVYMCRAPSWGILTSWTVAAATLTSIVVSGGVATVTTPTAHGLFVGAAVTISGSTDSALNASAPIVASVPSSTTFTLNRTYTDGSHTGSGLAVSSYAPRTSAATWSILRVTTSGADTEVRTSRLGQICDNRAATGANQVAYH